MTAKEREILGLIAELAHAASLWEGGAQEGVAYATAEWRRRMLEIEAKAIGLAKDTSHNTQAS